MYDVIVQIIGHDVDPQYVYYVCCAAIPLLAVVIIDITRDIFSSFIRG